MSNSIYLCIRNKKLQISKFAMCHTVQYCPVHKIKHSGFMYSNYHVISFHKIVNSLNPT